MNEVTVKIVFMSAEWQVTGEYYSGTNFLIHGGSLDPNDDPEFEIETVDPIGFSVPDDFLEVFPSHDHLATWTMAYKNATRKHKMNVVIRSHLC